MKKLEAAHYRWQRSILGISRKDKVTNEKVREATALPKLEDIIRCRRLRWLGIFHAWNVTGFHDKLIIGNLMVSGEGLGTHVKTGGSHQQGSQEDMNRMGQGTGDSGGQKLVDSCRLDEPGTRWCF